jgi:hypothetical protein
MCMQMCMRQTTNDCGNRALTDIQIGHVGHGIKMARVMVVRGSSMMEVTAVVTGLRR